MEDLVGIAAFGAVRIQMIGIDHRHQGTHCGLALLEAITGIARKLSESVAERSVSMRLDLLAPGRTGADSQPVASLPTAAAGQ